MYATCSCCLLWRASWGHAYIPSFPVSTPPVFDCLQYAKILRSDQNQSCCSPIASACPPIASALAAARHLHPLRISCCSLARLHPLQLLLPVCVRFQLLLPDCTRFSCCCMLAACVHFSCCSRSRPLRLLLPDCVRFDCCSPDCVRFDCCSPIGVEGLGMRLGIQTGATLYIAGICTAVISMNGAFQ